MSKCVFVNAKSLGQGKYADVAKKKKSIDKTEYFKCKIPFAC